MDELITLGFRRVEKAHPQFFDTAVGVIGSREFPNLPLVKNFVAHLTPWVEVVSGGARGVDRTAADAARARDLRVTEFLPDKRLPIPERFYARNREIVDHLYDTGGVLVGFVSTQDDGRLSGGSMYTVRYAQQDQPSVPTVVFTPHPDPITRKTRLFAYENLAMMAHVSFYRGPCERRETMLEVRSGQAPF